MATIDLSAGWVTAMIPKLFRLTDGTGFFNGSYGGQAAVVGLLNAGYNSTSAGHGQLRLMKGAVPASATTHATLNERIADQLVLWQAGGAGGSNSPGDFSVANVAVNPAIIATVYANATATGTASWFWLTAGTPASGSPAASLTSPLIHQIIGTVGGPGSGADLIIPSTAIVSGQPYRVVNFQLQFPTSWTY